MYNSQRCKNEPELKYGKDFSHLCPKLLKLISNSGTFNISAVYTQVNVFELFLVNYKLYKSRIEIIRLYSSFLSFFLCGNEWTLYGNRHLRGFLIHSIIYWAMNSA